MKRIVAVFTLLVPVLTLASQPEETGSVQWLRDHDKALAQSATSRKPVFALFQEVPGCAGCKQFGREVLSHPLIVEAIESEFTPLLIHNNTAGQDAEILKRYGEPAWNFQVVRFLTAEGEDLIARKDRVWDTGGIAQRMTAALKAAKRPVPNYLHLLEQEHSSKIRVAAFAMHCFWTGEMRLGQIEGVVSTEAGFIGSSEVTRVYYNTSQMTFADLLAKAQAVDCAHTVYLPADQMVQVAANRLRVLPLEGYHSAPVSDQKKQLQGTPLAMLGLSAAQMTKANAWVREDAGKAISYLSPRQLKGLRK